jgi:preprotein translocase subunit SecD
MFTQKIKFFSVITIFFISIYFASNGFLNFSSLFKNKINLGLDLVGGSSLTLEADFSQYINDLNQIAINDISQYLKTSHIEINSIEIQNGKIFLSFKNKIEIENAKNTKIFEKVTNGQYKIDYRENEIIFSFNSIYLENLKKDAISESIKNIQKRVDSLGDKEIILQPLGENRILLQAPGFSNPEELRYAVGKTAKLTFHIIANDSKTDLKKSELNNYSQNFKNFNIKILKDNLGQEYKVLKKVELDGTSISNAFATSNKNGNPVVTFSLNKNGTEKFSKLSGENIGKQLAVVIDDVVMTAPVIREAIHSGGVEISGNFSFDEAKNLASSLRAGALPIKLNIVEEKIVGSTLGDSLIHSGKISLIASFIIVTFFMIIVYGAIGFIASLAIILNLAMILSLMILSGATLSLAGIAGLVLTVGMVVDSNVLIFERIREELQKNKNAYISAIQIGFDRAISTIIDSNITTIIASILLFWFGDSNIRGFAITLTYGIIISFFTAVFFTKVIIQTFQLRILNYSFLLAKIFSK